MNISAKCAPAALAAVLIPVAAHAADGHVTYLEAVGPSERPMMLAASDRGVVFIDANHELFRAYHHQQTSTEGVAQPYLWVDDIDGDGREEVVGAGTPSFVIDDNADPMWGVLDGCDQYFVGDFIDDANAEFLCLRGTSVRVWAFDGQEYFNWAGSGFSVAGCSGDDFDSDRKLEVACALTNGSHLFFDIDEWFNDPSYDPIREGTAPDAIIEGGVDRSAQAAIAAGQRSLQAGAAEITLTYTGGAVALSSGGNPGTPVTVSGPGVYSATTADLNRDGRHEVYIGGADAVFVFATDGTLLATVPADPEATRRDARVAVRSATANGLELSDRDAVTGVVEAGLPSLRQCYERRMGADQFTRVGQMLYELTVSDAGRVTATQKRHSSLRNGDLESCVEGALRGLRFSAATGGTGTVSVTLDFDFVDAL